MTDLDKATTDTSAYEGYRAIPYLDSRGLWTAGEGTCLETNPISGKDWKYLLDNRLITVQLSGAGARWLLRGKLVGDLAALAPQFPGFASLPDLAQTLLLEIAYQLGVHGLLGLTTFVSLVSKQDWGNAAADGRGTLWYRQTPVRAEKILAQLEGIQ